MLSPLPVAPVEGGDGEGEPVIRDMVMSLINRFGMARSGPPFSSLVREEVKERLPMS